MPDEDTLADLGLDGVAVKPASADVEVAASLPLDVVTIDYEGPEHVPDPTVLGTLARTKSVRLTTPVRATGYDPLGDDGSYAPVPDDVGLVLVAGHPSYLSATERSRAIAPRLGAALGRCDDPWVGTEGIERLALATSAGQYELLSPTTSREVRALRAAGFGGELAVYAPTLLDATGDAILDAIGAYVARREPVRSELPDDPVTDSSAAGRTREVLISSVADYALVGEPDRIRRRIQELRAAGVDLVIGYLPTGLRQFVSGG